MTEVISDSALVAHPSTQTDIDNFIACPMHGLAIVGGEGAGKLFVANTIADALISSKQNLIHIDARAEGIGIDSVRELQKSLALTVPGAENIRRVVIIEHFDDFGHEAQNALLKTLEEPPVETVILLTISRQDHVLSTIYSRVSKLNVRPLSLDTANAALNKLYDDQKIKKTHLMSGGQAGLMTSLLDEKDDHPLVAAISAAKDLLKLPRHQRLGRVDAITKSKSLTSADILDGLYRLLDVSHKQIVVTGDNTKARISHQRLKLVSQAISDIEDGVSQKLVLTRLLFNL